MFTFFSLFFINSAVPFLTALFLNALKTKINIQIPFRYGFLGTCLFSSIFSLPLLFFPELLLTLFSPSLSSELQVLLVKTLRWTWVWISIGALNTTFLAFIFAAQKEAFCLKVKLFAYALSLLQMYYFICHLNWGPNTLWMILCTEYGIFLLACAIQTYILLRTRYVQTASKISF